MACLLAMMVCTQPGWASTTTGIHPAGKHTQTGAAAKAIVKPNRYARSNRGRLRLSHYLDNLAYEMSTSRRVAMAGIATRSEAKARQARVRSKILHLIGGLPERTPLHARTVGVTQGDGFRVEKVIFDSQPHFPVTALLYLPDKRPGVSRGKLPAIVISPGHSPWGKASDYPIDSIFARNGFAVLDYDAIGEGERLQYPDLATGRSRLSRATGEHGEAGLQPTLIGDSIARYFIWDAMRAVDYLQTLPEIDANRIGAFGCSGGGTITAMFAALDRRIKVIGTACYITSFDTLLPAIGPQDAEQSITHFISAGLDFPDWIELAAPRPYAVIATYHGIFPFAGTQKSVDEARRFYGLFGASHQLAFITGPGHHGNLGPIMPRIVNFFIHNLRPAWDKPGEAFPRPKPGTQYLPAPRLAASAFRVTRTGQVANSIPGTLTVHDLNLERAAQKAPGDPFERSAGPAALQKAIREVTGADIVPGEPHSETRPATVSPEKGVPGDFKADSDVYFEHVTLHPRAGIDLEGILAEQRSQGMHPAVLLLTNAASMPADSASHRSLIVRMERLARAGKVVFALTPRPSPPGTEEVKSPILGDFYLTELRAELVGKTILGMRVDDTIRAVNYLVSQQHVNARDITAYGSWHLGLVLLHAAMLDSRLRHVYVDHALVSYRSLLEAPMPVGAPQDILPGVLLHYDIPDVVHFLGSRLTLKDSLTGSEDLSRQTNSND